MVQKLAVLFILAVGTAFAGDLEQQIRHLPPPDAKSRGEAMVLDHLQNRARQALGRIKHASTREEAEAVQASVRKQLTEALGVTRLPWPPKLKARTVGILERQGYRIEKVVFESLPGVQVPAHLYLPGGLRAAAPAILFYSGHWWAEGKTHPDFQAFCINAARLGFVVFAFDPFGQGERGVSSRDHRRTEALLAGIAQQGFAEYETQCALEYLLKRKEVDPKRVGMTGASGGGYNTWITSVLDSRIRVAVPVVGTSEFYRQIEVCRPGDWYEAGEHCHFVPGLIRFANNHEFLAAVAPRPLLMIAATGDHSFPPDTVREVYDYGKKLYQAFGQEDRIGFFEDTVEGHGYQRPKRELAYAWFLRWLMGQATPRPQPEPETVVPPFDSPELRCFPVGQNRAAGPGMMEIVRDLLRQKASLPPLESILGDLPPLQPASPDILDQPVQRLLIRSESDIKVPAFLARPGQPEAGLILVVDDEGKEATLDDPVVREALGDGWAICGVDPRGIGELAVSKPGWAFAVSLLLREHFPWYQGWDISVVREVFRQSDVFRNKPIVLYASGPGACLAATYSLAQRFPDSGRLDAFILRDGFLSLRDFIHRPKSMPLSFALRPDNDVPRSFDREIPSYFFPFQGLRYFDFADLLESSGARGLILNAINGDWEPVPVDDIEKVKLSPSIRVTSGVESGNAVVDFLDGVRKR